MLSYEDSLKYYRDIKNSLDTARDEGRTEEKKKMARQMLKESERLEKIQKFTGLSKEEIKKLQG